MKVLIIGFGSIGKRHYEVLSRFSHIKNIDLVTKQEISDIVCYKSLDSVERLEDYDYFVIASETNKHFEQLLFLENRVKDKLIFCEKPLFGTREILDIKNNVVLIGYVLRFHPLLQRLKEMVKNETIISAYAKCGQYLPLWRPHVDYRDSYSAKKDEGGGVLLDLSHEIDYIQWLCGKLEDVKSYQVKISDLKIDSDDLTMVIGKTCRGILVNISMDYISKINHRRLMVETLEHTYELDFVKNILIRKDKMQNEELYNSESLERNEMFKSMHLDIFEKKKSICTYNSALEVMSTIHAIQEQNK